MQHEINMEIEAGKENEEELIDFVEKILDFGIDLDHSMEAAWDNKNKLKSEAEHLQQRLEKAGERVLNMLNDGLKTTIADRLMQLSEKIGMHSEDCDKRELCLNRLTESVSIDATNTEDALKYWNTKEAFFISELRGNKPQRIRLGCLGLQIGDCKFLALHEAREFGDRYRESLGSHVTRRALFSVDGSLAVMGNRKVWLFRKDFSLITSIGFSGNTFCLAADGNVLIHQLNQDCIEVYSGATLLRKWPPLPWDDEIYRIALGSDGRVFALGSRNHYHHQRHPKVAVCSKTGQIDFFMILKDPCIPFEVCGYDDGSLIVASRTPLSCLTWLSKYPICPEAHAEWDLSFKHSLQGFCVDKRTGFIYLAYKMKRSDRHIAVISSQGQILWDLCPGWTEDGYGISIRPDDQDPDRSLLALCAYRGIKLFYLTY